MLHESDVMALSGKTVAIVYESVPKLKGGKKNPMQGRIVKRSFGTVTLSESDAYAERKVTEGEFEKKTEVRKRTWGVRAGDSCVIMHKGKVYVEFFADDVSSEFFLDDEPIEKSEIEGYQPNVRDSEVKIACVKLENILELAFKPV